MSDALILLTCCCSYCFCCSLWPLAMTRGNELFCSWQTALIAVTFGTFGMNPKDAGSPSRPCLLVSDPSGVSASELVWAASALHPGLCSASTPTCSATRGPASAPPVSSAGGLTSGWPRSAGALKGPSSVFRACALSCLEVCRRVP